MTGRKVADFVESWKDKGDEKQDTQRFWMELLHIVLGIENPARHLLFEKKVKLEDSTRFIDGYIPKTKVLIEQKGKHIDLSKPELQSGGASLTPYNQARRYDNNLPHEEKARWIICCNFQRFEIHDMSKPLAEPEVVLLEDLEKESYRLQFLVDSENEHIRKEMEVSLRAGEVIGEIYDAFLKEYRNPNDPQTLKSLNVLCVRLVFCLFAEDSGLFGSKSHSAFHDYLVRFKPGSGDMRRALIDLFDILNTPVEERDPYLDETLLAFPYVSGGLFAQRNIEIPRLNDEIANLILKHASDDFDWSQISPTIFGAVFESTLNPQTRRSGGMHYTSVENIHKVIDPLFLDDLKDELSQIKVITQPKEKIRKAKAFQDKLAGLKFLDPACGSGNFLTETFLSLRRLENEAIRIISQDNMIIGFEDDNSWIKVGIHQFHGIEINDFAVATATTALWIAEAQMFRETESIIQREMDFFPLKPYTNIVEGNALRMDWNEVVPASELNYIMGNPPFVGARWMTSEQKEDVINTFGKDWKGVGDLDYVSCWYKLTFEYIKHTCVRCALVSTNSITQGGAVAILWKPLFEIGLHFDFAYRTFRWDSEANSKAQVHCVIIGFSVANYSGQKKIYDGDIVTIASNINGYLLDSPTIFIEKRMHPISDVPEISLGGQPIDDGNLTLTEEDKTLLINDEPAAQQFIRPYMMGSDFIQRKPRYCLWLKGANPSELKKCPKVLERVKKVRDFRMQSNRSSTLKAAETPTLFGAPFECVGDYVALPKVSSENRRYIPIDYLTADIIPGDKLFCMQNATKYDFGIMNSNVHMSWMRAVCGRLKSDYSYSNTIVYNNFPWPTPTDAQKAKIEKTAQVILDARNLYPYCSLADLYDEVTMPLELRKAHQENDKAVMEAYGFHIRMSEPEIVSELFKLYQLLIK